MSPLFVSSDRVDYDLLRLGSIDRLSAWDPTRGRGRVLTSLGLQDPTARLNRRRLIRLDTDQKNDLCDVSSLCLGCLHTLFHESIAGCMVLQSTNTVVVVNLV